MLLSDVELDELVHTSGFHSDPDGKEFTDELAKGTRPPGCVHTVDVADRNIYEHAGPTAVLTGRRSRPPAQWIRAWWSSARSKRRRASSDMSKLSWVVCAGFSVTTGGSAPATWRLEPVEFADGIPTQRATRSDRVGEQCQHAMGVAVATVVEAMCAAPV